MTGMQQLTDAIEVKRKQLNDLANQYQHQLLHPEVLAASEELDKLIYLKMKSQS